MKLLLIEDDIPLAQALQQSLRHENYSVDCVNNGKAGITAVKTGDYGALILDLGLPDIDGFDVLKAIKSGKNTLPVLILTARDSAQDKVKGLDLGADDYLAKPFDMAELFARLRVFERRAGTANSAIITHGQVTLDTSANLTYINKQPISFSRREYMIIKSLMENIGRIQSKQQLENKLYEWGEEVASNTIEVHVHHVRKKLPEGFIKTVRGVGYIISKT